MARTLKPNYLYKQPKSQNWWIRLQFNGNAAKIANRKEFRISLKTTDIQEANLRAAFYIYWHNSILAQAKGLDVNPLRIESDRIPVGEHWINGIKTIATATDVITVDNGVITQTKQSDDIVFNIMPPAPKPSHPDDDFIETWVTDKNIDKNTANDARLVWKLFKELTNNKPLKHCDRDDGRLLAKTLKANGDKMGTVKKKVAVLSAAVNNVYDDKKLTINPFFKVAPAPTDSVIRLPFSTDDMLLFKNNIHILSPEDQLLFRMLALTGMRLDEPFQIKEEFNEDGIRYVFVGSKNEQSKRRLPLPTSLLPMLPTKILQPLFTSKVKTAGKHLNLFIDNYVDDVRKPLHSLRHRAKDRLRAIGCPLDIQYQILGHEEKTVAAGYGVGYPLKTLLNWLDKIGE